MKTRILGAHDVGEVLSIEATLTAVEQALAGGWRAGPSSQSMLGVHVPGGGFHVKAATLEVEGRRYFVSKTNGNIPGNPERRGLPTIQGILVLSDAESGVPLAVMDSTVVTELRTAAATGVAARHLAKRDSSVATVVGCGRQGRAHLRVLSWLFGLERCWAVDRDETAADRFASAMSAELGIPIEVASAPDRVARMSDIVVTCTTSDRPLLTAGDIGPGTFVAGVGADNPSKQELDASLLAASRLVVDSLEQCRRIGDLSHAIHAGLIEADAVFPELGQIVDGRAPGRISDSETIVFDSTGTAYQDVAAAVVAYVRSIESGRGIEVDFAGRAFRHHERGSFLR